jgi:selenocysteine lyase/cysteine desulfurase
MGYNDSESQEIWAQYRDQFPVTERLVYLNHAAVAPLPRCGAEAMKNLADDACLFGSQHYSQWLECYDGFRVSAARLMNAAPAEIAMAKNTSEGIATVALGLDWKPGDKIVAFREEFPANFYIWKKLEEWKGVRVEWLSYLDSLETIERAAEGARLLAISFVQYLSGFRADLEAIGAICRRQSVFFFVDAIQGLGAFPLDVRRMNIQALAADGHKWLLGPEGHGILYVQQDWQDRIQPIEFGWTTVAGFNDYSSRDMAVRHDAGRYECGTLNTICSFGLKASMDLLLEVGIPRIAAQVQALGDQLAQGARDRGYEIMGERTPQNAAGIVSIRKPGTDARVIHAHLRERGIMTAPRQGWVRFSPHFYISPADIDRVLNELPL